MDGVPFHSLHERSPQVDQTIVTPLQTYSITFTYLTGVILDADT